MAILGEYMLPARLTLCVRVGHNFFDMANSARAMITYKHCTWHGDDLRVMEYVEE